MITGFTAHVKSFIFISSHGADKVVHFQPKRRISLCEHIVNIRNSLYRASQNLPWMRPTSRTILSLSYGHESVQAWPVRLLFCNSFGIWNESDGYGGVKSALRVKRRVRMKIVINNLQIVSAVFLFNLFQVYSWKYFIWCLMNGFILLISKWYQFD